MARVYAMQCSLYAQNALARTTTVPRYALTQFIKARAIASASNVFIIIFGVEMKSLGVYRAYISQAHTARSLYKTAARTHYGAVCIRNIIHRHG